MKKIRSIQSGRITKLAVLGYPIAHSLSPLIHNYWIERHGFAATYEAIEVPPLAFLRTLKRLTEEEGYRGLNITLPHKEVALGLCHETDRLARAIGAVNTISERSGKLFGTNTDVYGFVENLREALPDFDFKSGPAVLLGAGGAARAVMHALLLQGCPQIRVANRTLTRALDMQHKAQDPRRVKIFAWEERHEALGDAAIVINATHLGMYGQAPLELYLAKMPSRTVVYDIVYRPQQTDLIILAQRRGNPVVTGLGMLLHQARPAFQSWFGILPDIDAELRRKVETRTEQEFDP
ncbi:MAG: shikimate dehydrogenase [Alphaproteobacteria bacterium]|nr:shikimate dehydrogenase [Alphaproteobacteria bacterium]